MSANPTPSKTTTAGAAAETCGECGAAIPPGEQAFMRGSTILCQNCWSKETTSRPVWLKCPVCASEMRNIKVRAHVLFVRYLLFVLGFGGLFYVDAVMTHRRGKLDFTSMLFLVLVGLSFTLFSWVEAWRKKKVHRCLVCEYTVRAE